MTNEHSRLPRPNLVRRRGAHHCQPSLPTASISTMSYLRLRALLRAALCLSFPAALSAALSDYNVVWDAPSRNSGESMPCGGGDIGLNVWVENGDLLITLSRSGTFDELNGMPKLGRVRVTLSPNPFATGG